MRSAKRSSRTTPSNRWMQCTTSLRRRRSTSNVIEKSSNPSLPSPISSSHHDMEMVLLSRRENLSLDGKKALKVLLAANKRLNTAYVLKESFGQLWSYEREGW